MRLKSLAIIGFLLTAYGCHSVKWNSLNADSELLAAPDQVQAIFKSYPNEIMVLEANSPGFGYKYDIGEKDAFYGDTTSFRFEKVTISLHEKMRINAKSCC
ncbi:MAG: hypothetical protein GQ574_21315 [Crocinitomix sp.]|nr:hypothetical protein [Crocinitomix sp.]